MASVSSESGDNLELNLMPMLDIFSILITFLLMSYSTDPVSYDINAGTELPESITLTSLDELQGLAGGPVAAVSAWHGACAALNRERRRDP